MGSTATLNRKPMSGQLFGWIKDGSYIPYPDIYAQKKEEAKALTFGIISASSKVNPNVDLDPHVMETLVKYQNKLLLYRVQSGVEPDFFDKIGAFALALATTQSPVIKHIPDKLAVGNRCNILIAVEFAVLACKDPDLIKNHGSLVPSTNFERIFTAEQLRVIKRSLSKALSHETRDLMPFTCKLMDFYMTAFRLAETKVKPFVPTLN